MSIRPDELKRFVLFATLAAFCLAAGGCSSPAAAQASADQPAVEHEPANQPTAEHRPTAGRTPRGGLIGSLYDAFRRLVSDGSAESAEIEKQLDAAQQAFSRIKLENAEALNRAGRQLRLKKCNSPNIVLIVADDLGLGDLGCYGQRLILTPYLDRLAAQGIRFTEFYAGSPLGTPSRCALATGLDTGHATIRGNRPPVPLADADRTLAEVLWQAGYATGLIGKWALGGPGTTGAATRQGFEYFFGFHDPQHAQDHYPEFLWRNEEQVSILANQGGARRRYAHDLLTQEALVFLDQHAQRPFFLEVDYTLPHAPLEVPSDAPYTAEDWPQPQKNYAAMVTRLDQHVGLIMQRLGELGVDSNTLVIFTSDNGPHRDDGFDPDFFQSARRLRGRKGELYEGGIRVPLVARWPARIPPGQTCSTPCAMWDLLPTLAHLVEAFELPANLSGGSLAPLLFGGLANDARYLYWETHQDDFAQAIRYGEWKGVRRGRNAPLEVYHLKSDPGETTDVAAKVPEIVERLTAQLERARIDSPQWPIGTAL